MASLQTDIIDGNPVVLKVDDFMLPSPMPLKDWTESNQKFTALLRKMVVDSFKAQDSFKEAIADSEVLTIISKTMGKEILGKLEQEMGFKLQTVATSDAWEYEEVPQEEAVGVVEMNDPLRILIVKYAIDWLSSTIPRSTKILDRRTLSVLPKLAVNNLRTYVEKQFPNLLDEEVEVKTPTVGRYMVSPGSIPDFYLQNVRDILLQEGWIVAVAGKSTSNDILLPPGAGVKNCHFLPKDGSKDHPYWVN